MPQPNAGDVHVNAILTNISIAFVQRAENFVAGQVFPIVPVQKQSDRYYTYDRSYWWRNEAKERAPSTESAGAGWVVDATPTYYCRKYALHKDIDDDTRVNADQPIDMDRDATTFLTQSLLIQREKLWASTFFTTGIWGQDLTGVSSGPSTNQFLQWDSVNSTPMDDIEAGKIIIERKTGYTPNTLVLGRATYAQLKNHPDVLDRIKYTQRGMLTKDLLAALFEVDRVLVPMGVENTAAEGDAAVYAFIVGDKTALLCYSAPSPGILQPSAGYTFAWTGLLGAGAFGNRIKRFRMELLSSDRVEAEIAYEQKLVSAECGVYYATAVA